MPTDQQYMLRCFDLARLGAGLVSPNPLVGAVIVHQGRIIGEGFHGRYGGLHAEVRAIESVAPEDASLLSRATLYVSLEPCCVYGKTPPCTNLIIEKQIPRVVISCLDASPEVNGRGIAQLEAAGVAVRVGVLEDEGKRLSRFRSAFVTQKRPYIILKYARTRNGFFAPPQPGQYWISGEWSRRLVHKWRSEVDAILVGSATARIDNPELTNRYYFGPSPCRVVLDRKLTLAGDLKLFDGTAPTLVVTHQSPPAVNGKIKYLQMDFDRPAFLSRLLAALAERGRSTLLVEGGARLLTNFIREGLWDEARVLIGQRELPSGIPAPVLPVPPSSRHPLGPDEVQVFYPAAGQSLNFI